MTMSPEKRATELLIRQTQTHPPHTINTRKNNKKKLKKIIFNLLYKCSGPYFSRAATGQWQQIDKKKTSPKFNTKSFI